MKKLIPVFIINIIICSSHINAQNKKLKITIGQREFSLTLVNNETAQKFVELLPIKVNMTEMSGYEKFYYMPQNLPGIAKNVDTTYQGDLMIWSSNYLVLFYATKPTSYSYNQLGKINNTAGLREALGLGNIRVTFEIDCNESIRRNPNLYRITTSPVTSCFQIPDDVEQFPTFNMDGTTVLKVKN